MKKKLKVLYFHTPIRSKIWMTRRARNLERKVIAVWNFAIPYGDIAIGTMMVHNEMAGSVTSATIFFSEVSDTVLHLIEKALCCGEFHAEVLTNGKQQDTIKPCHADTEQHQTLPAP